MTTTVRAPGKLYIAGEYAVVEPGRPAIVVAVDRTITVDARTGYDRFSSTTGTVIGALEDERDCVPFHIRNGAVQFPAHCVQRTRYVRAALTVAERYIAELGGKPRALDLVLRSTMVSRSKVKLGLGSSGSVTVAIIGAVLAHRGVHVTPQLAYRLAMLATIQIDENASGGDLAAAAYGGWILYRSPDRRALKRQIGSERYIRSIVETDWLPNRIERLPDPTNHALFAGWTGVPAGTGRQVDTLRDAVSQGLIDLNTFHNASARSVETIATALRLRDENQFDRGIIESREALRQLDNWQGGNKIFSAELQTLCECADSVGVVSKPSGAGGGDCGIAFTKGHKQKEDLASLWRDYRIEPLNVQPHSQSLEVKSDRTCGL